MLKATLQAVAGAIVGYMLYATVFLALGDYSTKQHAELMAWHCANGAVSYSHFENGVLSERAC